MIYALQNEVQIFYHLTNLSIIFTTFAKKIIN